MFLAEQYVLSGCGEAHLRVLQPQSKFGDAVICLWLVSGQDHMAQGGFLLYPLQLVCVVLLLGRAGVPLNPLPRLEAGPLAGLAMLRCSKLQSRLGLAVACVCIGAITFTYLVQL